MGIETLAMVGQGLQIGGAISAGLGAYNKSKQDQAAYNYQAQMADWQARDALTRGQQAEQQQRLRTARLKGTQRASLAARGIDLGEGSALNILTDTDVMGEQDALQIRDNAMREAWSYRQQESLLRSRADAENPAGAAFSTLLTGAGSVASSWYKYRQTFGDSGVYDYKNDASGSKFSATGADIRARR